MLTLKIAMIACAAGLIGSALYRQAKIRHRRRCEESAFRIRY